jgi:hypothetical protein
MIELKYKFLNGLNNTSFCVSQPYLCPSNISYALKLDLGPTSLSSAFSLTNSAKPGAVELFDLGLKLYNLFWFDLAQTSFQLSRTADPHYVMSYWGEAMTHKFPIWHTESPIEATKILDSIPASSLNSLNAVEYGLLNASRLYFDPNQNTLSRETSYAKAMQQIYAMPSTQNISDIGSLYCLSLLGLASNPGHSDALNQSMKEASVLLQKYPDHRGLLHIWTHLTDDHKLYKEGTSRGVDLARLSPGATHAVHMKSHLVMIMLSNTIFPIPACYHNFGILTNHFY